MTTEPAPPPLLLIVDDDEGLRQLTRRRLERAGYRVALAADAPAAWQAVETARPALLVLDYDLKAPQTGLDFFRRLGDAGIIIPAILVTGFTDASRVIEALRSGVSDVLPKSGDYLDYLPEAVGRLLEQITLKAQLAGAETVRERELYYRTLAEAIPQLVWTCGADGQCDFLSKQWLDFTGRPEAEQLGTGWLTQSLHPHDVPRTRAAWREAVGGNSDYDIEFRLRRHDGVYRWFKARGVAVRSADGTVTKWFGTCTDIEVNKQADHEREALLASERTARAEAERAVRVKDEFVATLSHELRTPLNAIVGWTQFLLRDSADPAKLAKGLEVINRNAHLQAQMVDDLLDMSRIMSGKLRLDVGTVDLAEVIGNVASSVQHAAHAKDITLNATVVDDVLIQGDASRLQQVLWNLVMNAIKFTPKGGAIHLALRRQTDDAMIIVQDTGQGIKPEFLPHVFDRFRQEDATTTRKFNGLGLGLAITRQLVEMHGGRIEADSTGEQQGATFTVYLPLSSVRALDAAATAVARPVDVAPSLTGLHVLLVDDEPDGRELVQRVLEERGARVTSCESAAQGFSAFRTERPDVIISDIGMPEQDGYQFIRRIRLLEGTALPCIPAAALTAMARSEDRRRALLAGFQTHVAKPIDPLELVAVLAALTGRTGQHAD